MIDLALRHVHSNWRVNCGVLLCLTLASAFLVSLSGYFAATAQRELSQTLAQAQPAERNLLITGPRHTFTGELYGTLQEVLGEVLAERIVIRHATVSGDPQAAIKTDAKPEVATVEVYSFNALADMVRVAEGRLPTQVRLSEAVGTWRPPPIEAVISLGAVERSGYAVGDRVTAGKGYHRLDIVGKVEPLDPRADLWGGALRGFEIDQDQVEHSGDGVALPLIIAPGSMRSVFPDVPVFPHDVTWRITLNHHLINMDRAERLRSQLVNFQTQSATVDATVSTGLVRLITGFLARLSRARIVLILVTAQSLAFAMYTLTLFTSAVVHGSSAELATFSARGASAWQIVGLFALENLFLALPAALVLGPAAAHGIVRLWVLSGLGSGGVAKVAMSDEAWLLSGLAAGLGWLALVGPVFFAARRGPDGWQQLRARPAQKSILHRLHVDLYVLGFGSLLTWQLNRSGSFVIRAVANRNPGSTPLADPLLLVGPTMLLIGAAMAAMRAVPLVFGPISEWARRLRGLVLPLGLSRLARDPLQPSRVVLLVSLTVGLVVFTATFRNTMAQGQDPLQPDALAQGMASALQLNALTLVLFSITAYVVVHLVQAEGRWRDYGVLRPMGLAFQQWLALLFVEGLPVLMLGLVAGTAVGLGLSGIMMPYLSQALTGSLGGVAIGFIRIDWPATVRSLVLVTGMYSSGLVLLALVLGRAAVRRAPAAMGE